MLTSTLSSFLRRRLMFKCHFTHPVYPTVWRRRRVNLPKPQCTTGCLAPQANKFLTQTTAGHFFLPYFSTDTFFDEAALKLFGKKCNNNNFVDNKINCWFINNKCLFVVIYLFTKIILNITDVLEYQKRKNFQVSHILTFS